METVAETKESVTGLAGLMQDHAGGTHRDHDDVRYVRTTVTALARVTPQHRAN